MGKSILLEKNARKIADIASENLGEEIILLDTRKISVFSDYSILVTENLAQKIMRAMKKDGKKIHQKEGTGKTGWILLDYFGLSVHILSKRSRENYDLEDLWSNAKEIVRLQ